ncbi:DNA primase [Marinimicrobium sp. ABcell2]|uniref:DNA primase n=1 Tax=Marinimicrobium sp. ABcell2 TaxID=3069751 RepID=UPI0027B446C3|nr:DNA primase [Marinimicrobium sp. ABcell2]MDQ2076270.1 DNA primase [Marinimicrobium sp. ABcell2]
MAGLIPQSFIDDLLDRLDIVEVVDHRVKLKRTGKNYSACCPFHDEKTPSFTVSPDKQFYYCFGCGASGNALGFIMDYERMAFPEAVEQLANLAGLEVPRETQTQAQREQAETKKSLYTLLEQADDYFQDQLRTSPARSHAVDYLKRRGLDGRIAKDYGIGFAPPGWDNLLKALGQDAENQQLLIEGGMLIHYPEEKKLYDRFRHRIMFPIRDTRGRVIGFGGRVLGDDKPKYLNSPETPVFHKGQELYGLYEAKLAYRELPRLLVVEGYMDVVSLAQFGIRYGVATLGTACGEEHLLRAFRHTKEVVFCFDGDKAGRQAAQRALLNSLPVMEDGRQVKFLFLPEGEDPDTLVRQVGAEKFTRMVEMAVPLEDYLFDAVSEDINLRSMEGRARLSKRAAPLIHKLPRGVFRELMFDNLATRTGLNRQMLQELVAEPVELAALAEPEPRREPTASPAHEPPMAAPDDYEDYAAQASAAPSGPPDTAPSRPVLRTGKYLMPPAHKAIGLLLTYPVLAAEADQDEWLTRDEPELQLLGQLLTLLRERPHYQLSHIIGYWRGTYGAEETERLAHIAGHDLLSAATAQAQPRQDKPARANYDTRAAFGDCLNKLRQHLKAKKSALSLAKLKEADFTKMTREERQALVKEALAYKNSQ